ncbi:MAG: hypothetical protein LM564_03980 [Desulfurococcaceae archaeon]|nr:hypothetical protein [Desulfurococcaceae archaeon]
MGRYDRYYNITVRREVYEELRRLAEAHGLSVPDFLALVAKTYDLVGALSRLTEVLGKSQYVTGNIPVSQGNPNPPIATSNPPPVTSSTTSASTAQQKSKRSAWEILEERGVSCVSEMKAKDPDSVMDKLAEGGAYVVSWDKDRCAILPEVYEGLLKLLPEVKASDPERAITLLKARDSRYARVFRVLYRAGALYYDREEGWRVDEEFIERGGGE